MGANDGTLQVAIVGAGGVGGLVGGLLARGGDDVTFVVPESTASVLNSEGLRVESDRYGTFHVAANAVSRLSVATEVCVVAVKSMQLEAAAERVPAEFVSEGIVVPFLNGVDHVETLRQVYGLSVVAGTVRVASARRRPGVIEHSSPFMRVELALGSDLGTGLRDKALRFGDRLSSTGIDVDVCDDELSMLWGKLIFLCPLALLTTRYGISAGQVRTSHRVELVAVIDEISHVGQAVGASLDAGAALEFFDSVPDTMQSSMQHDASAGNELELDAIGGAVVRAGHRSGIPTPATNKLINELRKQVGRQNLDR
jgi:2-dehydropantoate 2-reductase